MPGFPHPGPLPEGEGDKEHLRRIFTVTVQVASPPRRPPLVLRPRPSRLLMAFLALSHGGAFALVLGLPIDWGGRAALLVGVALSLAWDALTHVWPRAPWAIRDAVLGEQGWELTLGRGRRGPVALAPSTFVGTWLIVLNFRSGSQRPDSGQSGSWRAWPWRPGGWPSPSLVVLPDSLDEPTRRRLRVRLRLGEGGAASEG